MGSWGARVSRVAGIALTRLNGQQGMFGAALTTLFWLSELPSVFRLPKFPFVQNLDAFKDGSLVRGVSRVANVMHPLILEAVEPPLQRSRMR